MSFIINFSHLGGGNLLEFLGGTILESEPVLL
jgi:hypothetical protein